MNPLKVGDPVVCINAEVLPEQYIEIKENEQYEIAWIGMCGSYLHGEYLGVRLKGIRRGVCPQFGEEDVPFRASRFRPLVGVGPKAKVKEEELV